MSMKTFFEKQEYCFVLGLENTQIVQFQNLSFYIPWILQFFFKILSYFLIFLFSFDDVQLILPQEKEIIDTNYWEKGFLAPRTILETNSVIFGQCPSSPRFEEHI